MKSLILAFQFLTILPLPHQNLQDKHFGQSMMFFPLVGLFIGGTLYALHLLAEYQNVFSSRVEAFLLLFVSTLLSRALHVEGFADFLDGFLGGQSRANILEIMQDSRAGVFAVIGVVLLLLGKYVALCEVLDSNKLLLVVTVPVLARWGMVLLFYRAQDPRKKGGLARPFLQSLRGGHVLVGSVLAVSISFFLLRFAAIPFILLTLTTMWLVRKVATRQIAGVTGDVAGACAELTELLLLLVGSTVWL